MYKGIAARLWKFWQETTEKDIRRKSVFLIELFTKSSTKDYLKEL